MPRPMRFSRRQPVPGSKASKELVPVPGSSGTHFSRNVSLVSTLPPITNDTSFVICKRYNTQGTSGTTSVSRGALLNLFGMATAANAGYRIANSVRIRKICGWVAPATTSSYGNASFFQWTSANSPSKLIDCSAQQGQYGCYFETRPPKDSLAGFYSLQGSNESEVLFQIATLGGCTLDVTLEFTLMNSISNSPSPLTNTISGATIGDLMSANLDNLSGGKFGPSNQNRT